MKNRRERQKARGTHLTDLDVERVDGVDRPAHGSDFLVLKSEDPDEIRENAAELVEKGRAVFEALAAEDDLELSDETIDAMGEFADLVEYDLDEITKAKKKKPPKKPMADDEEDDGDEDVKKAGGARGSMPPGQHGKMKPKKTPTKGFDPDSERRRRRTRKDEDDYEDGDESDERVEAADADELVDTIKSNPKLARRLVKLLAPALVEEIRAMPDPDDEEEDDDSARRVRKQSRQVPEDDPNDRPGKKPVKKEAPKLGDGLFTNIIFGDSPTRH